MAKSRRVTMQDKWIIGGDGTWMDLMVVSPLTKLALDFIYALSHPRKYYTLKKTIASIVYAVWAAIQLPPPVALLALGAFILWLYATTQLYRYAKTHYHHYRYAKKESNEPFVPLDVTGDPHSAILLTRHVLIGGDSGSGKSNAVWMILEGLSKYRIPFKISVIDPAGGVELNDLQDSPYTTQYVDRPTDADQLITDFRDQMNERLRLMKATSIRQFDPRTPLVGDDNNWHYLIIDELLLCAQQIKQGPLSPLGDVLAVGRKAGYIVIALTQLGQKTTLGDFRDLFPQRIAFATRTHEMTDAILGTSAHQSAPAHLIHMVGEGYLYNEKAKGYYRFHTKHITDTQRIAFPEHLSL